MVNKDFLNMDDDIIKFFVLWFVFRVVDIGIRLVISSWNNYIILG